MEEQVARDSKASSGVFTPRPAVVKFGFVRKHRRNLGNFHTQCHRSHGKQTWCAELLHEIYSQMMKIKMSMMNRYHNWNQDHGCLPHAQLHLRETQPLRICQHLSTSETIGLSTESVELVVINEMFHLNTCFSSRYANGAIHGLVKPHNYARSLWQCEECFDPYTTMEATGNMPRAKHLVPPSKTIARTLTDSILPVVIAYGFFLCEKLGKSIVQLLCIDNLSPSHA